MWSSCWEFLILKLHMVLKTYLMLKLTLGIWGKMTRIVDVDILLERNERRLPKIIWCIVLLSSRKWKFSHCRRLANIIRIKPSHWCQEHHSKVKGSHYFIDISLSSAHFPRLLLPTAFHDSYSVTIFNIALFLFSLFFYCCIHEYWNSKHKRVVGSRREGRTACLLGVWR